MSVGGWGGGEKETGIVGVLLGMLPVVGNTVVLALEERAVVETRDVVDTVVDLVGSRVMEAVALVLLLLVVPGVVESSRSRVWRTSSLAVKLAGKLEICTKPERA